MRFEEVRRPAQPARSLAASAGTAPATPRPEPIHDPAGACPLRGRTAFRQLRELVVAQGQHLKARRQAVAHVAQGGQLVEADMELAQRRHLPQHGQACQPVVGHVEARDLRQVLHLVRQGRQAVVVDGELHQERQLAERRRQLLQRIVRGEQLAQLAVHAEALGQAAQLAVRDVLWAWSQR